MATTPISKEETSTKGNRVLPTTFGINDARQIVGFSRMESDDPTVNVYHAFLWEDGIMTDLGTLPDFQSSTATGINNAGQIVGTASRGRGGRVGVLWDNGEIAALYDVLPAAADWQTIELATGINDKGQVTGQGYRSGKYYGFLMTPTGD